MSERERWIVYPLLFLALGAALRDKLSEQTRTKRIECQELIVFSDDSAGQPPVPLVRIGALERASAESPHVAQILVNGSIETRAINADAYLFHRIPFAPTFLKAIPSVLPTDWLRALQRSAEALGDEAESPPAADEKSNPPAE